MADGLAKWKWRDFIPKPKYKVKTEERQRPENVKEQIVKKREFKNIRTVSEQVAEFTYRPGKCKKTCRVIVLRKNLLVERGEFVLFDDIRYFFFITNEWTVSAQEIVYFARERCDHENDIEQLKNGVNALRMPVQDLISNWAYMVIAALAWNLKAGYGLLTSKAPRRQEILRQLNLMSELEGRSMSKIRLVLHSFSPFEIILCDAFNG